MIGIYNGKEYLACFSKRKKEIVTRKKIKADESFREDEGTYSKPVDEKELTDIFSVKFYVDYDAGIPGTPHTWAIDEDVSRPEKGQLVLVFARGTLPGWEIEERYVCTKTIDFDAVKAITISTTYEKKDGQIMDPPYVDERVITKEEMIKLFDHFKRTNL